MPDAEMRIKKVPEELHKSLRKWAIDEGQTLNDWVIALLQRAVDKRGNK